MLDTPHALCHKPQFGLRCTFLHFLHLPIYADFYLTNMHYFLPVLSSPPPPNPGCKNPDWLKVPGPLCCHLVVVPHAAPCWEGASASGSEEPGDREKSLLARNCRGFEGKRRTQILRFHSEGPAVITLLSIMALAARAPSPLFCPLALCIHPNKKVICHLWSKNFLCCTPTHPRNVFVKVCEE